MARVLTALRRADQRLRTEWMDLRAEWMDFRAEWAERMGVRSAWSR